MIEQLLRQVQELCTTNRFTIFEYYFDSHGNHHAILRITLPNGKSDYVTTYGKDLETCLKTLIDNATIKLSKPAT